MPNVSRNVRGDVYAVRFVAVPKFGPRCQFTPWTGAVVNGLKRASDAVVVLVRTDWPIVFSDTAPPLTNTDAPPQPHRSNVLNALTRTACRNRSTLRVPADLTVNLYDADRSVRFEVSVRYASRGVKK